NQRLKVLRLVAHFTLQCFFSAQPCVVISFSFCAGVRGPPRPEECIASGSGFGNRARSVSGDFGVAGHHAGGSARRKALCSWSTGHFSHTLSRCDCSITDHAARCTQCSQRATNDRRPECSSGRLVAQPGESGLSLIPLEDEIYELLLHPASIQDRRDELEDTTRRRR